MNRIVALSLVSGTAWAQAATGDSTEPFGTPCHYPSSALHDGVEGKTVISYRGTKTGEVTDVKLVKSSHFYSLDDATLTCVQHWRFDPNQPLSSALIGMHQAAIQWTIPFTIPEAPSKPPAGRLVDAPHK